jgi:uncharacterized membrane protein
MERVTMEQQARSMIERLETSERVDALGSAVGLGADVVASGRRGDVLRGRWLGHALHPLLTDLPLGCWLSACLLDLGGGRSSRKAARRLVGMGLLAAVPTAASGLAEYDTIDSERTARVAAVHGAGNVGVIVCYLASWRARRGGHHLRGVTWGLAGGLLAIVTGYLGGHLSFARGVGAGERWSPTSPSEAVTSPSEAEYELGIGVADVVLPVG